MQMSEYLGIVAVSASTAILVGATILLFIRSYRQQQKDDQALDAQMQTEGDEQQHTCNIEGQSPSEQVLAEEQQEKDCDVAEDDDGGNNSDNAGRQSSDVVPTASDYLRETCGYYFRDGKLIDTKSGKGFVFKGQQDYEVLGEVMNEVIYELLERDGDLEMKMLGNYDGTPRGFCFASKDIDTNANGMLVLIHGTGVVRAGQWSRRLIINHSLESGSQIPYIQEAKKRNWSVVVMNTNQRSDHYRSINGGAFFMGYDPEEHGVEVWKAIIEGSPAKRIAIVAHSYGGSVTSSLLREMGCLFKEKVFAIALTDSWCSVKSSDQAYFKKVAKNWVTSKYPVGQSVGYGYDCEQVSAGTSVHEETSWKAIENVFEFIDTKFQAAQSNVKTDADSSSQYMNAEEKEATKFPMYQHEPRDDSNAQAVHDISAENAVDQPLESSSGNSEDNANVKAGEQATGDGNIQSTANLYVEKSDLDNIAEGSLQMDINNVPSVDACGLQQHHAIVEDPNRLTSIGIEREEFCTGASTAGDAVAAGDIVAVGDIVAAGDIVATGDIVASPTGRATESSDTLLLLSQMTKENSDTIAETHQSVADFANSTTNHPVGDISLVPSEKKNPEFEMPAAPVDNEGKSEAAELLDSNFDRSSVISDNNLSANGCSDQSLDGVKYPRPEATASMLSQQPSCSHVGESYLKQPLTEAGEAGSLATALGQL